MRIKKKNVTDETIERKATATAAGPPSKQTQSPEPRKMKGPQQQTLKDVSTTLKQTISEERMKNTDESTTREAAATAAGETEASAVHNNKTM